MTAIFKSGTLKILCFMLIMLLTGCTNSKIIISPLYNQLDDRMRKEFNKLANFNDQQTAAFEASLGTYHVWHRQAELPQYAALLKTIAGSIEQKTTTRELVEDWFQQVEGHSRAARECHPVNYSLELIRTLSDEQLNYIERRFQKEQAKNRARYDSFSPEERVQRRLDRMEKWAERLGLKFTDEQQSILLSAFERQKSLRKEYYQLSAKWNRELFKLARNQSVPEYKALLGAHFDKLWSLLESAYPQQWQENRNLWQQTAFDFEQSLTDNQRKRFSRWISRLGNTLYSISNDKPSFKMGDDPAVGCLVPAAEQQRPG